MPVDLHPVATASPEARLAAANSEITHLRARNAALTRRINGALHLVNTFDPAAGVGYTAVLLVDLRYTLGESAEANR